MIRHDTQARRERIAALVAREPEIETAALVARFGVSTTVIAECRAAAGVVVPGHALGVVPGPKRRSAWGRR